MPNVGWSVKSTGGMNTGKGNCSLYSVALVGITITIALEVRDRVGKVCGHPAHLLAGMACQLLTSFYYILISLLLLLLCMCACASTLRTGEYVLGVCFSFRLLRSQGLN